jgi:ABC-2 type transport system ATP-binding protein
MLAIETAGLTRLFGDKRAVSDLALAVPEGAFYGFLGPNGAGKSTTIKMLTGLLSPSAGGARVLGLELGRELLAVKRQVGVVPDGLGLFERLSGAEQLRIHGQLYGLPAAEARRRALKIKFCRRMGEVYPRAIRLVEQGKVDVAALVKSQIVPGDRQT